MSGDLGRWAAAARSAALPVHRAKPRHAPGAATACRRAQHPTSTPRHTHTCTHKRIHTLGAGVFVTTGYVASHIAGPGVIISYIAAGISAALSSFVYAEVRSMC